MSRILAISSQVTYGHLGLSAAVPALQALGHDVMALPTVLLSNEPGERPSAGQRIAPDVLADIEAALWRNGWMDGVAAVTTGYLPTPGHVEVAAAIIRRLRAHHPVLVVCDPVLGDDDVGVYIDPLAAALVRDQLIPAVDILTPNHFEIGWLTGTRPAGLGAVLAATRQLESGLDRKPGSGRRPGPKVVVTSASRTADTVTSLLVTASGAVSATVPWLDRVPHGTGDLFAALLLGHLLHGKDDVAAFASAVSGVERVVGRSAGADALQLVAALQEAVTAHPATVTAI